MNAKTKAKVRARAIKLHEAPAYIPLPDSLTKAAGLLKGKKRVDALKYQRAIRREWEERFKELVRVYRHDAR